MNKLEQWNEVERLCNLHKVDQKLITALGTLLQPKTRGVDRKEPKEIDGKMHLWCTKFLKYLPEEDFPIYKGKPLHFCKEAEKIFRVHMKKTKELKAELSSLMAKVLDGEIELEEGRKQKAILDDKIAKNEEIRLGTYDN